MSKVILRELSARLPYHVNVYIEGFRSGILTGIEGDRFSTENGINYLIRDAKPYLRKMDSMTDDEKKEYDELCDCCLERDSIDYNISTLNRGQLICVIDWLNEHHFDYRHLIERGLAMEAPKDMYNLKE